MTQPIYMDSHATTPLDPRVLEAMLPVLTTVFGNASSSQHRFGWEAGALVEQARARVAGLIHAEPSEIVFTSGATESNNLAVKGVAHRRRKGHIVTCAAEHRSVLDCCRRLEHQGFQVTYLPVLKTGLIDVAELEAAFTPETILVTIMMANNEIGTLQPVAEIGAACRRRRVYFHCDAVQAAAWEPIDVQALGIDLLSLSAHKMYGPKGVGALYLRRRDPRVAVEPLFDGGGHEGGIRPGTLNTAGIVGFGRAAELAAAEGSADSGRVRALRDRLLEKLRLSPGGVIVNGTLERRLPNNLNISFENIGSNSPIGVLGDIALSSAAACASASEEPSHVLAAIGLPAGLAATSLRFGLHRFSAEQEIEAAAAAVSAATVRLRR